MQGKVFITGSGSGDSELITIKARRAIRRADIIFYDYGVSQDVLNEFKMGAILICVTSENGRNCYTQDDINTMVYESTFKYQNVLRLKKGNPFLEKWGFVESSYLKEKRVSYELIPVVEPIDVRMVG